MEFLPLSKVFYDLMLDFYVKTGIRFSLRDKRLFEITEVEITRVDYSCLRVKTVFLAYYKEIARAIVRTIPMYRLQ